MKKVLIIVIALFGLVASIFFAFRNEGAVKTSVAQQWPGQMGTLETVGERWPRLEANHASVKLISLVESLPKNDRALDDFVAREITRDEITIGEPPALPDVSAIRDLLLREPVAWERYDEVGDEHAIAMRAMQMTMARALVANALTKARNGTPVAWDDLHAVWKLARSLDGHPQMMAQTAALSIAHDQRGRLENAAARTDMA